MPFACLICVDSLVYLIAEMEIALDLDPIGEVDEGVRMLLHRIHKGGNVPAVDDGDDHVVFFAGVHTPAIYDGGAVLVLVEDLIADLFRILCDDLDFQSIALFSQDRRYRPLKHKDLYHGKQDACQVPVNKVGAGDDAVADDADDSLHIQIRLFLVYKACDDVNAAGGTADLQHERSGDTQSNAGKNSGNQSVADSVYLLQSCGDEGIKVYVFQNNNTEGIQQDK